MNAKKNRNHVSQKHSYLPLYIYIFVFCFLVCFFWGGLFFSILSVQVFNAVKSQSLLLAWLHSQVLCQIRRRRIWSKKHQIDDVIYKERTTTPLYKNIICYFSFCDTKYTYGQSVGESRRYLSLHTHTHTHTKERQCCFSVKLLCLSVSFCRVEVFPGLYNFPDASHFLPTLCTWRRLLSSMLST